MLFERGTHARIEPGLEYRPRVHQHRNHPTRVHARARFLARTEQVRVREEFSPSRAEADAAPGCGRISFSGGNKTI